MQLSNVLLAVLGIAGLSIGAPIELDSIVVDNSLNTTDERVSGARQAIYTSYTGTSNNGRGCTGSQISSTSDSIGDGGAPDTCTPASGAGCALLADFVPGDGNCFVRLYQNNVNCTGTSIRFDGQNIVDSVTYNYVAFEAQCLAN